MQKLGLGTVGWICSDINDKTQHLADGHKYLLGSTAEENHEGNGGKK